MRHKYLLHVGAEYMKLIRLKSGAVNVIIVFMSVTHAVAKRSPENSGLNGTSTAIYKTNW